MLKKISKKEKYCHLCLNCKEEFDYYEKKENCSICNNRFDNIVKYISARSLGCFDIYECNICKIRFEKIKGNDMCPECGVPAIYNGYIWKCGKVSLFRRLLSWICQF